MFCDTENDCYSHYSYHQYESPIWSSYLYNLIKFLTKSLVFICTKANHQPKFVKSCTT